MKHGMKTVGKRLDEGRPTLLRMLEARVVTEGDVAVLRREVFAERPPTRVEIEDLFALDAVTQPAHDAWVAFFVDVATDFLVWDQSPTGVVSEADANWLLVKADATQTPACLALLINILEEAHRVPRGFPTAVRARAIAGWAASAGDAAVAA